MLLQSFVSSYNSIEKKVFAFGKNKNYNQKQNFLQQIFIPPAKLKINVEGECPENHDWFLIIFMMALKYVNLKLLFKYLMTV